MWDKCLNCGETAPAAYWCDECRLKLPAVDKWYLAGFKNSFGFAKQTGVAWEEADSRRKAYEMGVADREGIES